MSDSSIGVGEPYCGHITLPKLSGRFCSRCAWRIAHNGIDRRGLLLAGTTIEIQSELAKNRTANPANTVRLRFKIDYTCYREINSRRAEAMRKFMCQNCTMMVQQVVRRLRMRVGCCSSWACHQSDDQKNWYSWKSTSRKSLRIPPQVHTIGIVQLRRMSQSNSQIHAFWPYDLVIAICKSRMYSQSGAASGPPGWYQASCSVQNSILGSCLILNTLVSLLYRDVSLAIRD